MIVRCEKWIECDGNRGDCAHYEPHEHEGKYGSCDNCKCTHIGRIVLSCIPIMENDITKAFDDIERVIFGDELDKYPSKPSKKTEPSKKVKKLKSIRKSGTTRWVTENDDVWST